MSRKIDWSELLANLPALLPSRRLLTNPAGWRHSVPPSGTESEAWGEELGLHVQQHDGQDRKSQGFVRNPQA
jgi:hypothetical protein